MTMHKVLHPNDDIDSICQENEEEENSPALSIV